MIEYIKLYTCMQFEFRILPEKVITVQDILPKRNARNLVKLLCSMILIYLLIAMFVCTARDQTASRQIKLQVDR